MDTYTHGDFCMTDSSFGRQIQCGAATLMNQAPDTAGLYLSEAIRKIDKLLGEGYAKKNPALIAGFMQVCAADLTASFALMGVEKLEDKAEAILGLLEEWRANKEP